MRRWGLCAICAFVALLTGQAARADTVALSHVGGWEIDIFSDGSGFVECLASRANPDGSGYAFGVDPNARWEIVLDNPNWRLMQGPAFPVQLVFDDGDAWNAKGKALSKTAAVIWLGAATDILPVIKQRRSLRIGASGGTFDLDLTGSRRALEAAYDCIVKRGGGRSSTAGVSPAPQDADPASANPSSDPFSAQSNQEAPGGANLSETGNPPGDATSRPQPLTWNPDVRMYWPFPQFGSWINHAHDDSNGIFLECTSVLIDTSAVGLIIKLSREHEWSLILVGGWQDGGRHRVSFALDGGEVLLSVVSPVIAGQLDVPLTETLSGLPGEEAKVLEQIRHARRIDFQVGQQSLSYPLARIDQAMDAMVSCVDRLKAEQTAPH